MSSGVGLRLWRECLWSPAMSDPSRPASRRTSRGALGPANRPVPRPPFLILTGSEEIQVESLGSMALRLSHPGPKDGWRIVDDGGSEWRAADLQAALLDPEGRRPSDPQRSRIDDEDERSPGIGRHATLIGVGMVVAGIVLLGTCMGGGAQTPRPAVPSTDPVAEPVRPPPVPVPAQTIPSLPAVSAADLANGLISHYNFASAETIGRNGTSTPGCDAVASVAVAVDRDLVRGKNVALFAGNGYLELPVRVRGDFTIAWWMRTTQNEPLPPFLPGMTEVGWFQGVGLVSGETPGVVADYGCMLITGRIAFGVGQPDTTVLSQAQVSDGAWHHIATVRDDISGTIAIFIDGQPDRVGKGPRGQRSAPTALLVGTNVPGFGGYVGRLDDLRFYGRQLPPAEIAALARPPGHQPLTR